MAETFSFPTDKYVLIGKVAKAHGIKGELKLISFSGELNRLSRHKVLTLVSNSDVVLPVYNVLQSRIGKKEVLVRLEGINDRNQAEELAGCGVLVLKKDLPELTDDEFYLHELEGITVVTEKGDVIGRVVSFFDNGIQDILVVKNESDEFLIPLIPGMIVAQTSDRLTIAPPPGLLEINSGDDA
jgi:16S rRNA processing protein RimM